MIAPPVLDVVGVSKRYRVGGRRRNYREVLALRDVDIAVNPGEVVAVIGRNGAGKSTLMKVAAGVTTPTSGAVHRPDRIAPLIEVGAGFHPDLTGRENVEVNAQLLGLTRREVRRRFDEIVAFAELEHAIDQSVGQYSSGMFMRLGFSVAIHTDPQLLIVDEVLAVGDLPFQVRCLDRIRDMRAAGVGVLFVTHHLATVLELADRAVLLDRGAEVVAGDPAEVIGAFHSLVSTGADGAARNGVARNGVPNGMPDDGTLDIVAAVVVDDDGDERALWTPGARATLRVTFEATAATAEGAVGLVIQKDGGGLVAAWQALDGPYLPPLGPGDRATVDLSFGVNLSEGRYTVDVGVARRDFTAALIYETNVASVAVAARKGARGLLDISPAIAVDSPSEVLR